MRRVWGRGVLGQVAVDGGLKVDDRSEDTAPDALAGEFREKAFDGIEPGAGLRGEVERPARMPGEPGFDLGMFVGAVIVEDGMDQFPGRDRALDGIEKADELLMGMALHTAAEDDAIERVESGKQGGCAEALVIMSHGAAGAGFGRALGSGISHRSTEPRHAPAGAYRGRQCLRPSRRRRDRWNA